MCSEIGEWEIFESIDEMSDLHIRIGVWEKQFVSLGTQMLNVLVQGVQLKRRTITEK